jgi:hypothetical protein
MCQTSAKEADAWSTHESIRSSFEEPLSGSESVRESRYQTLRRMLNTDSEGDDSDSDDSVEEYNRFQEYDPNHYLPRQVPFQGWGTSLRTSYDARNAYDLHFPTLRSSHARASSLPGHRHYLSHLL